MPSHRLRASIDWVHVAPMPACTLARPIACLPRYPPEQSHKETKCVELTWTSLSGSAVWPGGLKHKGKPQCLCECFSLHFTLRGRVVFRDAKAWPCKGRACANIVQSAARCMEIGGLELKEHEMRLQPAIRMSTAVHRDGRMFAHGPLECRDPPFGLGTDMTPTI